MTPVFATGFFLLFIGALLLLVAILNPQRLGLSFRGGYIGVDNPFRDSSNAYRTMGWATGFLLIGAGIYMTLNQPGDSDPTKPSPTAISTPATISPNPTATVASQRTVQPVDGNPKLVFQRIQNHNVIDPDGKRWEKFQTGENVPGIYLSLNFDHLGDFLLLRSDQTLFGEVGDKLVDGSWDRLEDKMNLTWAVRSN